VSVYPSVPPSNILLTRRLSEVWLDGRVEGRWGLSLTHKHKWGGEFSLTHTLKSGGEFSLTHTLKWGGEFSLTHALKLGGDFSLTLSNEKVSSQSLTLPSSFTCVNGSTYSVWYKRFSTYHMLAMKPNYQNVQIWYICKNPWATTNWYNLSWSFSVYLIIAHLIPQ